MTLKAIIGLALIVSLWLTVFGFGLQTASKDLLYVVRRPGLALRALLAVFVIMPIVAVVLTRLFDLPPPLEVLLIALAISPVPPLLPKKQAKAGGEAAYGVRLMAVLALASVVTIPVTLEILQRYFGRPLEIAPGAIASTAMYGLIVPLAAGVALKSLWPEFAGRIDGPLAKLRGVLLLLAVLGILYVAYPALWAVVQGPAILAIVLFVAIGLVVGHVLGGPDQSSVLALATASRHPAIAMTVATTNFPEQQYVGSVLLYLLLAAIVAMPYVARQSRK